MAKNGWIASCEQPDEHPAFIGRGKSSPGEIEI
jgi:hypothetical protein